MPLGDILGNSAFGASNDIIVIAAVADITGVEAIGEVGDVSITGAAVVPITGVETIGYVGNFVGWVDIATTQNPNWAVVNTR